MSFWHATAPLAALHGFPPFDALITPQKETTHEPQPEGGLMRTITVGLSIAGLCAATAAAQDRHVTKSSRSDCAALAATAFADVRITQAVAVAAPAAPRAAIRVAHCKVSGVIGKETRFELLLADDWNGRFFMGGAGGFAGAVENMARSSVNSGYATVGTDAGHNANGLTAGWALNNPERLADYGYRAVHRTAEVAKQIIRAYYGSAPDKSYFFGCSNGGREALMEAQRFRADFNGIVAAAPAADFAGIAASFVRTLQAQYPTADFTKPAITSANLQLLRASVLAACDARDGVRDRILDDPRACDFKVASIGACPDDVAAPDCLTTPQRAAIERVYAPVTVQGRAVYSGQPMGNEAEPGGWSAWITGVDAGAMAATGNHAPTVQGAFGTEFFKYMVTADSTWDYTKYDVSHSPADTKHAAEILSAINPDLSAFKARGGKLILAHGWSDPALNPLETIKYYEAVRARDPSAETYVRLYIMPGVLHCTGGPGCDLVDWYTPIADWVEHGKAPGALVAAKAAPSAVTTSASPFSRTRPLCPYPQHAVYGGTGSTDEAASFTCK
jgi:feruloyl esterase